MRDQFPSEEMQLETKDEQELSAATYKLRK